MSSLPKYVLLLAYCSSTGKPFKVQYKTSPELLSAIGVALATRREAESGGADGAGVEYADFSYEIEARYREIGGCPVCHNKSLFMCHKCGAMVCYDGEAGDATCPKCGQKVSVPSQETSKIVLSYDYTPRKPLRVLLCLDVSGSMREDNALGRAKQASVRDYVNQQAVGTQIGVVAFNTTAKLLCRLTDKFSKVAAAINAMTCGGGTVAPLEAIATGREFADFVNDDTYERRIVILTDGYWGNPATLNKAKEVAESLKAKGIKIITLDYGTTGERTEYLKSVSTVAIAGDIETLFARGAKIGGGN